MKKVTSFLLIILTSLSISAQPMLNPNNIDKVIKAMTIQEKAELLVGSIEGMNFTGVPLPTGNESGYQRVPGAGGQTNTIPRLGVVPTVVADGPAGLRISPKRKDNDNTYYCTGFPVEILLASTWDTKVLFEVGCAMGAETRDYGVDVILGPAVNVMRNPLCGRNFEYYSEDPILSGKMAAAMIKGVQSEGVGTSVKHFAANNQETNRENNDSRVSQRALREIYLKPFEIAVKESQPWTIMSSYNKVNGVHAQSNYNLLTKVLREDWGFKGIVMTDWTATRQSEKQIAAGSDLLMPGRKEQIEQIVSAVNDGRLSTKELDTSVRRMLEYIVKTPRFNQFEYSDKPDLKSHAQVSRKAASQGVILLKNDGVLPIKASKVALLGLHSYDFLHDGMGSGHVNTPYIINLVQALSAKSFKTDNLLEEFYTKYLELASAKWNFNPYSKMPLMENIGISAPAEEPELPGTAYPTIVADNDLAIITLGRKPGEGVDRNVIDDFELTKEEKVLIENTCKVFHGAGKKVIVILNVGGVVETASWKDLPDAIVLAWQPGLEGGNVIADILTGEVNPSGRLPITFPRKYSDVPGYQDYPSTYGASSGGHGVIEALTRVVESDGNLKNYDYTEYSEGIYVGYRHYQTNDIDVSYPFGYGLSYTSFEYSNPTITRKGDKYISTITVTNTGAVSGREVIQLYVSAPQSHIDKPMTELKAFAKTKELSPGESETLQMSFSAYDLSSFDEQSSSFVTEKGSYVAYFNTDVLSVQACLPFTVTSSRTYPVSRIK